MRITIDEIRAHKDSIPTSQIRLLSSPTIQLLRYLQNLDNGISTRVTSALDVIVDNPTGTVSLTLRDILKAALDESITR